MNFSPIFKEITARVRHQKFRVLYCGEHLGKRIVISKYQSLCLLLVLKENSLVPEFIKSISYAEDTFVDGITIVGKNDVILMLDLNGNLWKLINAFEETDSLFMLDKECFYQWSCFKAFKLNKVYAVSASSSGFVCIGAKGKTQKLLLLTSSQLEDCTFEDIKSAQSNSYYLSTFSNNIQESVFKDELQFGNEVFVVSDRNSGKTYFCTTSTKNIIINISSNFLISFLNFEHAKCFLLCFKNGKLLFQLYNSSLSPCAEFLSKNLAFIDKCSCCSSGLIWSDGIYLHHTNIQFQLEKSHFIKLTHTKLTPQIKGMISCVKIDQGFFGITVNNMYYFFTTNIPPENQASLHHFVVDISQAGSQIEKLNMDIKNCIEFLENKEMIQNKNLVEGFEVVRDSKHIILKSNVCKIFNKNFWQVRQQVKTNNKKFVQLTDLEIDLSYGMELKIKRISLVDDNWLDVSLLGNFGCDFEFLLVCLKKLREEKKTNNEKLSKNLCEIAKKRTNE